MAYDFENFKNDAVSKPRNKAWSNWWKAANPGDKVSGYIRDVFYRAAEKNPDGTIAFQAARGITLEQTDGEMVNVSIKRIPFILADTDEFRLNDPLTVTFDKVLPPRQKGYKGAKQFSFYGKTQPENAAEKTVKELDAIDMAAQGVKEAADAAAEAAVDKEFNEMGAAATTTVPAAV